MESNKKEVQVTMLPTEEETKLNLYKYNLSSKPTYKEDDTPFGTMIIAHSIQVSKSQYLYFTSDEEIKKGDHYLYFLGNGNPELMECFEEDEAERCNDKTRSIGIISFKIISSTDPELIADGITQPSTAFIEAYVKANGVGFDKVLVEYEWLELVGKVLFVKSPHNPLESDECNYISKLKVDPNHNTITIHPIIEKVYNIEEVNDLLDRLANVLYPNKSPDESNMKLFMANWKSNNLK